MAKLSEEEVNALFAEYFKTKDIGIRNRLLENYLYIAEIVAKKFTNRGVEYEDLLQVASVALVKAIERFDPERGIKFSSFATPSLVGEIKNYFRDKTRVLHISRRDSEQLLKLTEAKNQLSCKGDNVKPADLAKAMGISEERVLELMEMQHAASVISMENFSGDEEEATLSDFVGQDDRGFSDIENKDFLKYSLSKLSKKEQQIIYERFWNEKSQKQVAEQLGVSQMYISRYEKKILSKMQELYKEGV